MNENLDNFEPLVKIKIIGVGQAGNNAVNRMFDEEIPNVELYVANTDKQVLATSKIELSHRLVLGEEVTHGLGAGGNPQVGKAAAEASENEIREIVKGTNLVFIVAGMGGGTGTGAAPVIAKIAKEEGCLTVAIVYRPFSFEGENKIKYSVEGLNNLKDNIDSIIVVSNDKILANSGNKGLNAAFGDGDLILIKSVRTIVDLIMIPSFINLDFADLKSLLADAGLIYIGFGEGSGPRASEDAAMNALSCPLLEQSIKGASKAICQITCGSDFSLYACQECIQKTIASCQEGLDLKIGISYNDQLQDEVLCSVIACGFSSDTIFAAPSKIDFLTHPTVNQVAKDNVETKAPIAEERKEQTSNDEDDIIPNFLDGNF